MALVIDDRVKELSTTTGTGNFSLNGAITGYKTFVAGIGNGNSTFYAIVSQQSDEWEVGFGLLSGGALQRTTVISSTNAGSLVNFSSGYKDVFVTAPASRLVYTDLSGVASITTDSVNTVLNKRYVTDAQISIIDNSEMNSIAYAVAL